MTLLERIQSALETNFEEHPSGCYWSFDGDAGDVAALLREAHAALTAQQAQLAQVAEREQELKALQDFLVDEGMAYRCESCQRFLKEEDVLFDCCDVPLCQEHYEALEGGRL